MILRNGNGDVLVLSLRFIKLRRNGFGGDESDERVRVATSGQL